MKTFQKKLAPKFISASVAVCLLFANGYAMKNNNSNSAKNSPPSVASLCSPGAAQTDLDLNNVRARFLTGGDMWWDYSSSSHGIYEVPKGSGIMPIYAGALWMGGFDNGNNLHVAAQEYRNGGNDWWPGPLDTTSATITSDQCTAYDHHWKITQAEVAAFANGSGPMTNAISTWPGNGNTSKGQAKYLAPFVDKDADGIYDPTKGDYPKFDLDGSIGCSETNCVPVDKLFGDECLWWVINDEGNIHTETTGLATGLEVHCQAFSFSTDDEINNMTFINYRIYNRSSLELDSAFIGIWCDPDLGCATNDYVGCDVTRGLGYVYNGTNDDGAGCSGELGYGASPPALGIDFFRGPIATPGDGIDNNHNCSVDEPCEQAVMTHFVYFTNGAAYPQGDPSSTVAAEWYNYLSGSWQDGTVFKYGGNGLSGGNGITTTPAAYCFPGNTDHKYEWGTGGNCTTHTAMPDWNEVTAGNTPNDRRLLESAGPFKLLPGAVNVVSAGVVWARSTSGAQASVSLMQFADTKAQALFDNCFQLSNGPDAPDISIQEFDKKLILYLTNSSTSNNYKEGYSEKDPYVSSVPNSAWKFQGYKLYQLKDVTVSSNDLSDANKARLVGIYDTKDTIGTIINYYIGQEPTPSYWQPKDMVDGTNSGVVHSIVLTKDLFASGDPTFVNHKSYYYMAIAYGYNADEVAADPTQSQGYNLPYIQGRRNIKAISGIPHIPSPYDGGITMGSSYGDGPMITRVEGTGNGGLKLDFTPATVSAILADPNGRTRMPQYEAGAGPINVRVIDPLNVTDNTDFVLKFDGPVVDSSMWTLINVTTGDTVHSDKSITLLNEKLILDWGISVAIVQVTNPGTSASTNNGFISASMTFADPSKKWLTAVADDDACDYGNWIRSGATGPCAYEPTYAGIDDGKIYQGILGGTWAPYRLCAATPSPVDYTQYYTGPAYNKNGSISNASLDKLASVDIVLTSDKSKWTRAVVLEMCEDQTMSANTSGNPNPARKFDFRRAPSVDKNGVANYPSTNNNDFPDGMGWFPGYAVNLETGERLNICFGENSALSSGTHNQNGGDMLWNPTTQVTDSIPWAAIDTVGPVMGGQHYIYVFGHNRDINVNSLSAKDSICVPNYDGGKRIRQLLGANNSAPADNPIRQNLFSDAMWVNIPLLAKGHSLLETDVTVKLRVGKSYKRGYSPAVFSSTTQMSDSSSTPQNNNYPMYKFNTSGLATKIKQADVAKQALDLINVVPNPYYAYDAYEGLAGQAQNGLDTRIKITNLPEVCTVSIYNISGVLIRTLKKGDVVTNLTPKNSSSSANWHDGSIDWDLKNNAAGGGTPVASGVYIIHVDVPGVGEKIVKAFVIMRPHDVGSF